MKTFIIRGSEVVEYEMQVEAKILQDAKQKFSIEVSNAIIDTGEVKSDFTGFQFDICEEVNNEQ